MLKLLGSNIGVIPLSDPPYSGKIHIPDTAQHHFRPDQGIIKYRGPDCKYLKVGDHVLFGGYTGSKISLQDEGIIYIMEEDGVMARITPGQTMIFALNEVKKVIEDAFDAYLLRGGVDVTDTEKVCVEEYKDVLETQFVNYVENRGMTR